MSLPIPPGAAPQGEATVGPLPPVPPPPPPPPTPAPQVHILPPEPTAKPKKRVKPKAPPKPTLSQITSWATEDRNFWDARNQRMMEDQELYQLSAPHFALIFGETAESRAASVVRNTPWRLVEKFSNVVGKEPTKIKAPARAANTAEAAERIEDFLRYWREEANLRWQQAIHAPLEREKAFYLALRGWLCALIGNNPHDKNFPWAFSLHDPINVYPRPGAGGLRHVTEQYSTTPGQLAADFPMFAGELERVFEGAKTASEATAGDTQGNSTAEVISYYDTHWWALVVNGELVTLKKHNYGFIPWIIRIHAGDATNGGEQLDLTQSAWRGVSVMQGVKRAYAQMNATLTQIYGEVRKAANPAMTIYYDEDAGHPAGVSTKAGARNFAIYNREKFVVEELTKIPPEVQHVLAALTEDINLAGLPPVLYGEGVPNLAGYAITLLNAAARDFFFSGTNALESFDKELYMRILQLYEEFGTAPVQFVGQKIGKRAAYGNEITPDDIAQNGTYVECKFGSIMPQDIIAMGNLGVQMVREHVVDRDWVRENIGVEDTQKMQKLVYKEMVNLDPDMVKFVMVPTAVFDANPTVGEFFMESILGQAAGGGAPAPPGNGRPGVPGPAPANGEPNGLPAEVLPPQMQSPGAPTNPQGGPNPGISPEAGALIRQAQGGQP